MAAIGKDCMFEPSSLILVYTGPGAHPTCIECCCTEIQELVQPGYHVVQVGAAELLDGGWEQATALLVMPGGRDIPYCLLLNGDGTSRIRRYVESGGAYLGICAGGYFGCGYVEFDKGGPLEVLGPRELRFFPGVARGPVYTGFRYEDDQGARAIRVRVEELRGKARILVPPGGSQPLADASNTSTKESGEEASASGRVKEGDEEKGAYVGLTYFNGGCEFLPMDRSSDRPWHADHIEVVATYVDEDGGAADASSNQAVSTPGQVNGASGGTSGQRENDSSPSRVAAASHGGHAAAVRCAVGRGVALLMGIHPEMSIVSRTTMARIYVSLTFRPGKAGLRELRGTRCGGCGECVP
eukprot:jgi/Mesvir1/3889/Mv19837-RA.1